MSSMGDARGFSLLEAMVSAVLFLVAVTAVVSAWRTVAGLQDTQTRRAVAVLLAEDTLDDLRLRQRGDSALALGHHERYFTKQRAESPTPVVLGYTVAWDVTAVGTESFVRVDLVVSWVGANGNAHRLPFVSFRPR